MRDERFLNPAYYPGTNSATVQQPFEYPWYTKVSHALLGRGREYNTDLDKLSQSVQEYLLSHRRNVFLPNGPEYKVLLWQCPPVHSPLVGHVYRKSSDDPFWSWFEKQKECEHWRDPVYTGTEILHAHASSFLEAWSDKIYHAIYMSRPWEESTLHFRFNRHDSRFNNLHGMLSYFVMQMVRRLEGSETYWEPEFESAIAFFKEVRACSTTDLIQFFLRFRGVPYLSDFFYIITCIDQCEDDIFGFLQKLRNTGNHVEVKLRVLVTSSGNKSCLRGLEGCSSIKVEDFVAPEEYYPHGLDRQNRRLWDELPALPTGTKTLVDQAIIACGSDFQLQGIILNWLGSSSHRNNLNVRAVEIIRGLSEPSPTTVHAAIRSSLPGDLQRVEKEVSIIVKTAFHPLSIDQVAWALVSGDTGEHLKNPEERQRATKFLIRELLPGLYELKHGELHLAHDCWKSTIDHTTDDTASHHARMAEICLKYLLASRGQEEMEHFAAEYLNGQVYPTNGQKHLTTYSVKFLSSHYQLAGEKRPQKMLFDFYNDARSRTGWYNAHHVLSSPLARGPHRPDLSPLPIVVQTGLKDLTEMFLESAKENESFEHGVGVALIEASRHGYTEIVNLLLKEVNIAAEVLRDAVLAAASYGSVEPLYTLVSRGAGIKDFEWPQDILHRVSWLGLATVVQKLLNSGVTANPSQQPQSSEAMSPLMACMLGRHKEVAELLIKEGKANVNFTSSTDDNALFQAAKWGNPDIVHLLLSLGVHTDGQDRNGKQVLEIACDGGAFTTVEELLKAQEQKTKGLEALESDTLAELLTEVVSSGYVQCAKALLGRGIDVNLHGIGGTALQAAVRKEALEMARILLNHGANPNVTTEEAKSPLLESVDNASIPMVKLLLENKADVELEDKFKDIQRRTALASASGYDNKELLQVVLDAGADVNHIAINSHSPLLAAVYYEEIETVKILLERGADVNAVVSNPAGWAPINAAYDNPGIIKLLLKHGADINNLSSSGTVLYQAARWNFADTVESLLEHRDELDLEKCLKDESDPENDGMTPLCIACKYGRVGIMRLLLEAGANAKHETRDGSFPLELCLQFASSKEVPEQAMRTLLEYHSRIDLNQRDHNGNTALHDIVDDTPLSVVRALVNAGADFNIANNKNYTPFLVCLDTGNVEVAKYLLSKNASLNNTAISPLHLTCRGTKLESIKLLVEAGMDVNKVDDRTGETPLYAHLAMGRANLEVVQYLIASGADVNKIGGELKYPIIEACASSGEDIIRLLVEAGADINAEDDAGRRPVHVLWKNRYPDMDVIVKLGADLKARDKRGRTVVHYGAALCDADDVKKLLDDTGVDANNGDDDGWTPLMWACQQRRDWHMTGIVELLLGRGADIWARGQILDEQWSPLKLARFQGDYGPWQLGPLEPADKDQPRHPDSDDDPEFWDDEFHESYPGWNEVLVICHGCFCECRGIRWRCKDEHRNGYDLCFRCYPYRDLFHPQHEHFDERGERFAPEIETSYYSEDTLSNVSDNV
ncbi:ankyrin repeat-containing domain protein [Nemania sp. NC0429]|nr:ankyrin repeat-containing domain protein [Nemania sp. NC0429]